MRMRIRSFDNRNQDRTDKTSKFFNLQDAAPNLNLNFEEQSFFEVDKIEHE